MSPSQISCNSVRCIVVIHAPVKLNKSFAQCCKPTNFVAINEAFEQRFVPVENSKLSLEVITPVCHAANVHIYMYSYMIVTDNGPNVTLVTIDKHSVYNYNQCCYIKRAREVERDWKRAWFSNTQCFHSWPYSAKDINISCSLTYLHLYVCNILMHLCTTHRLVLIDYCRQTHMCTLGCPSITLI